MTSKGGQKPTQMSADFSSCCVVFVLFLIYWLKFQIFQPGWHVELGARQRVLRLNAKSMTHEGKKK